MTRLSRRTLLRGAGGVALALPLLEAFEARGEPLLTPKRFIGVFHASGVFTPDWFPKNATSQTAFDLGASHAALAPYRSHLLWTGGIDLSVALSGPGEQHQRGLGALFTGQGLGMGSFIGNDGSRAGWAKGQSLDQALVPVLGAGARVPSLQLGVHTMERDVSGVVSYSGADQPLLSQDDPQKVFHQLFLDGGGATSEAEKLRRRRGSVLDAVKVQLGTLSGKVSKADRARLDEHLTLVRELEVRVTQLPAGACVTPTEPPAIGYDTEAGMPEATALMIDLLVTAFRCDLTRIVTLSFSDAKNHVAMPFIDVTNDLHTLSHFADTEPTRAQLGKRDVWLAQQVASLIGKLLGATQANGRTLLDDTQLLWGSEVSRGNTHAHDDMPFVLAGHGAGFRMGRSARWNARPHNELLLAIFQGLGGTATTFGDPAYCAGPLTNLT